MQTSTQPRPLATIITDPVFGPYFFANVLSMTGSWFQNIAAAVLIYDLTGSNAAVGTVTVIQFGFMLALTLWSGGLADRFGRQRTMVAGQLVALLGASGLTLTVLQAELTSVTPVYAATAVIGFGMALTIPALLAFVPSLVEPRDLDQAITLNALTFNIARGLGPMLAGSVVAWFGIATAFAVNALSFVPFVLVLLFLTPRRPERLGGGKGPSIGETAQWFRERPPAMLLLLTAAVGGWMSDPFNTLVPALVADLGGTDAHVGLLVGCFGTGAALSAPIVGRLRAWLGRGRIMAAGLAVECGGLLVLANAPLLTLAAVGAAITGAGFLWCISSTNLELQQATSEASRGRVMAFWSMAFLGSRPFAAALDGVVADATSPRVAVLLPVAAGLLMAAWVWRAQPDGRQLATVDA